MVEALVVAMEAKGQQRGAYFVPDRQMLYSAQVLTQQLYAKIINTLRELAGGRPSSTVSIEGRDYILFLTPYCA